MSWQNADNIIDSIIGRKKENVKDNIEKIWSKMGDLKDKADIVTLKKEHMHMIVDLE